MYSSLEEAIESYDPEKKRKLLRTFVRRLEYDLQTDTIKVSAYAEPVSTVYMCHCVGAQDRT
jgi:hypothetical protein